MGGGALPARAPVAIAVREVVAKVGSGRGDGLAVGQHADVVPVDLIIPERRPPMAHGLLLEILEGPANRGIEQGQAGDRVIEGGDGVWIHLIQEGSLRPVAGKLGIMPVEAADIVCNAAVASPAEVLLHGLVGGAVSLLAHQLLCAGDRKLLPRLQGRAATSIGKVQVCFGGGLHHGRVASASGAASVPGCGCQAVGECSRGALGGNRG
mmetsp:Transcript_30066/g.84860  ORF Transcript_30066/g.84860 Transcript_30066/m.84860 type:complete len:209 (+) Transcript_30066:133-759(+)